MRGESGLWHLVGLSSFGRETCTGVSIFTRLSGFQAWITDIIKNN